MAKKIIILFFLLYTKALSQCPSNIGFENGNFNKWTCSNFLPLEVDNFIVPNTGPINQVHQIFKNVLPATKDAFGGFPVNCPNGSNYSIRLGHADGVGHFSSQRVSYSFTIPQNQSDYNITFNYAMVIMNSNHSTLQEPKFTVKVYDIDNQKYIDCKSLEIKVSNPSINFITTSFGTPTARILYKPWSTASVNLSGMSGKNIALEFTTSDCTSHGVHWCYAYIDIDENCPSPLITGNTYCKGDTSISIKGPNTIPATYTWYDSSFTKIVGYNNILQLSPPPPPGTKYALVLTPNLGFGCTDTIYTTVKYSGNTIDLKVKDSLQACYSPGADFTADSITKGSSSNLSFSYFTDSYLTNPVSFPKQVQNTGNYYITATNSAGCTVTKPVFINIDNPYIILNSIAPVCMPNTINLTDASLILTSSKGLVFSYWKDSATSVVLPNPMVVGLSGNYYIKGTLASGCSGIAKAIVNLYNAPAFSIATVYPVEHPATIDITTLFDTALQYSYWRDLQATNTLQLPKAVDSTGIYYIKGTDTNGCSSIKPISIVVTPPIHAPNAFSPNNDGINDTWQIPYLQFYANVSVQVYNRYGQLVFTSNGYNTAWDGKLNEKDLPIGTYYYIIKLTSKSAAISGSVTILK